jgi:predicted esterase
MLAPQFPSVKWIFPHAPSIPITLNGGMSMPGWYDIRSLDKSDPNEDEAGLRASLAKIEAFIHAEVTGGIKSENVILGGFSQGGAMTLLSSFMLSMKLGGFACLSGYLPLGSKIASLDTKTNAETKVCVSNADIPGSRDTRSSCAVRMGREE